jgi:hypothetical protein
MSRSTAFVSVNAPYRLLASRLPFTSMEIRLDVFTAATLNHRCGTATVRLTTVVGTPATHPLPDAPPPRQK